MATPYVLKNVRVYSGGYDLSGSLNAATVRYEYDEVEMTAFGDATHHSIPGLARLTFDLEGYAASDGVSGPDDVLSSALGGTAAPVLWAPLTGADGETAYFAKGPIVTYVPAGAVGEAYKFTASGVGDGSVLVRGTIMATGAKSSSGTGTARQLGAVSATQYVYGCLQVLAVSGSSPTLDVTVQSDDAQGFSSPATRLTFAQKTAIGAEFITPVAGAITDTWWRVSWTIGGSGSPSFTFVVAVGIQ